MLGKHLSDRSPYDFAEILSNKELDGTKYNIKGAFQLEDSF